MSLPVLSIVAFAVAIVLSCVTPVNVGLVSIAFAFIVGVVFGGMPVQDVARGFPSSLFLVLLGVTLLFSHAGVNGTLDQIAHRSLKLARGKPGWIPLVLFALAATIASAGPGNIAATAMLAPVGLAVAGRSGISAFLMTVMVATGANSGALSPFAPTGIIANGILGRMGINAPWPTFYNNFIAQTFVALSAYFLFGGIRLLRLKGEPKPADEQGLPPLTWQQKLTMALIAAWIGAVLFLKVEIGMGAFIAAAVLTLARASDEERAVKSLPWGTIIMVSGVTVLIAILEKTGGMDLFTSLLARLANPTNLTGVIAFVTGLISVYSSSSGVVLPAFLPMIPGIIEKVGGGDPLAIAASINVGSHLVDVSPLSTLGALCIASAPAHEDRRTLFNKLLAWGLSMSVVGALVCYLFFGVLAL